MNNKDELIFYELNYPGNYKMIMTNGKEEMILRHGELMSIKFMCNSIGNFITKLPNGRSNTINIPATDYDVLLFCDSELTARVYFTPHATNQIESVKNIAQDETTDEDKQPNNSSWGIWKIESL